MDPPCTTLLLPLNSAFPLHAQNNNSVPLLSLAWRNYYNSSESWQNMIGLATVMMCNLRISRFGGRCHNVGEERDEGKKGKDDMRKGRNNVGTPGR